MLSNHLWASLLALAPLAGFAQQSPRLYVGASAGLTRLPAFESYGHTKAGPAVTVGLQFSNRWALETGAHVTWTTETSSFFYFNGSTVEVYNTRVRSTMLIVPLLARYTFTDPAARLRVDALGGATWLHASDNVEYNRTQSGQSFSSSYSSSGNGIAVTLGPQLRYALGSAFEAKLNLPFNVGVTGNSSDFSSRLFLTPQLGMQYTFGG